MAKNSSFAPRPFRAPCADARHKCVGHFVLSALGRDKARVAAIGDKAHLDERRWHAREYRTCQNAALSAAYACRGVGFDRIGGQITLQNGPHGLVERISGIARPSLDLASGASHSLFAPATVWIIPAIPASASGIAVQTNKERGARIVSDFGAPPVGYKLVFALFCGHIANARRSQLLRELERNNPVQVIFN